MLWEVDASEGRALEAALVLRAGALAGTEAGTGAGSFAADFVNGNFGGAMMGRLKEC